MIRYMLDTNTVSHLIRGHATVARRVVGLPMASLCISAVTKGELLFGLAKRTGAARLHAAVTEFLRRIDVLAWDGDAADGYGPIRAALERQGRSLGSLDLLIAAHAISARAVLVTSDGTFAQVAALTLEDWTQP
jgi:tRNA(fMet)-specific endonuclease VapC